MGIGGKSDLGQALLARRVDRQRWGGGVRFVITFIRPFSGFAGLWVEAGRAARADRAGL